MHSWQGELGCQLLFGRLRSLVCGSCCGTTTAARVRAFARILYCIISSKLGQSSEKVLILRLRLSIVGLFVCKCVSSGEGQCPSR